MFLGGVLCVCGFGNLQSFVGEFYFLIQDVVLGFWGWRSLFREGVIQCFQFQVFSVGLGNWLVFIVIIGFCFRFGECLEVVLFVFLSFFEVLAVFFFLSLVFGFNCQFFIVIYLGIIVFMFEKSGVQECVFTWICVFLFVNKCGFFGVLQGVGMVLGVGVVWIFFQLFQF